MNLMCSPSPLFAESPAVIDRHPDSLRSCPERKKGQKQGECRKFKDKCFIHNQLKYIYVYCYEFSVRQ